MTDPYHTADFTRENYRRLLRLAREAYVFRRYAEFDRAERFVLWRHDVDLSMHAARKLARIEAEERVVATYFVNPHSEYYNLLERAVWDCVRDVMDAGHELALHFDFAFHGPEDDAALEACLRKDRRILEDFFGQPIRAFSFHNPDGRTARYRAWTYAGMINAYADYFAAQVGYVSDSNGLWRHRRLEDVLVSAEDPRLQVLTHPGWWQDKPMLPRERVERCIQGRARALSTAYDDALRAFDRHNAGAERAACETMV